MGYFLELRLGRAVFRFRLCKSQETVVNVVCGLSVLLVVGDHRPCSSQFENATKKKKCVTLWMHSGPSMYISQARPDDCFSALSSIVSTAVSENDGECLW